MLYRLDSDLLIDYLDGVAAVVTIVEPLSMEGVAISINSYMEAYQGTLRGSTVPQKLAAFVTGVPVLGISVAVAERCAAVRETLRLQGRRVRSRALDLLIAATAPEHDLTLVTRNTDDYRDIPGLKLFVP